MLCTIGDDLKHLHGTSRQDMGQAGDQCTSGPGPGALWTPWDVSGLCLRSGFNPLMTYAIFVVLCCCFPLLLLRSVGFHGVREMLVKTVLWRSLVQTSAWSRTIANTRCSQLWLDSWWKFFVLLSRSSFLICGYCPLYCSTTKNLALLSLQLVERKLDFF